MRYQAIDSRLFAENRAHFAQHLRPNSVAVFHSNDILPTSADGTMPFRQHSDIFYLSGIDQEESVLLLFPDNPNESHREVLFVRETSETIAIWEGHKLSKQEATEASGIGTVYWAHEFDSVFRSMVFDAEHIYLNTNEHLRAGGTADVETRDDRFRKSCMAQFPLHRYERSAPILHRLRAVKAPLEVALLQHACDITEKGFRRLLPFVRPGVWEYEIEAELAHEFLRNRSRGFAYDPIIASGASSCVLHYISNDRQCQDGDVLLLDIGAEYANYNADLTRVLPVNGRFSPRQRQVYKAVHRAMQYAISLLVPGNNLTDYTQEVSKFIEQELIGLGLLDKHDVAKQDPKNPLYRKYFMHGVSHHLGLNVHDYGHKRHAFEAGMVFTCEPGIYIREEGIGIRLENDLLITDHGPVDLMRNIPLDIDEIESLMNE
jgi:Xaa-Pro aminopeptidase